MGEKTEQKFQKFHEDNPQVYTKLVAMTEALKASGQRRVGMKMLFEVLRYDHAVRTRGDVFKLNNNYTSRYVRMIQVDHPDLAHLFEVRRMLTR